MLNFIAKNVENSQYGVNISVIAVVIIVLTVIICMFLIYLIKKGVFSAMARFVHLTRHAAKNHTREFNQAIGLRGLNTMLQRICFTAGWTHGRANTDIVRFMMRLRLCLG